MDYFHPGSPRGQHRSLSYLTRALDYARRTFQVVRRALLRPSRLPDYARHLRQETGLRHWLNSAAPNLEHQTMPASTVSTLTK